MKPLKFSLLAGLWAVIPLLAFSAAGQQSALTGTAPNYTLRDIVSVKDYDSTTGLPGATGNGSTDDTRAIQAAINRCPSGGTVLFPVGKYVITSTLQIATDQIRLVGQGPCVSTIYYKPTAAGPAILISKAANGVIPPADISRCSVSSLGVYAPTVSAYVTAAIKLVSASAARIEDVKIWGAGTNQTWSGASPSVGLQIQGKEDSTFTNIQSFADIPISIETNPLISVHNGNSMPIDADHFHFQDLYLIANSPYACVNIGDPVSLTQVTFDGRQAWVCGKYGLFWNNANASYANGLVIMNVRTEQGDPTGYSIWINNTSAHQQQYVIVTGLNADPNRNGIYLRRTWWTNIQNYSYGGAKVALDADSSNKRLLVHNSFFQIGSTLGSGTTLSPVPYSDGWVNTNP